MYRDVPKGVGQVQRRVPRPRSQYLSNLRQGGHLEPVAGDVAVLNREVDDEARLRPVPPRDREGPREEHRTTVLLEDALRQHGPQDGGHLRGRPSVARWQAQARWAVLPWPRQALPGQSACPGAARPLVGRPGQAAESPGVSGGPLGGPRRKHERAASPGGETRLRNHGPAEDGVHPRAEMEGWRRGGTGGTARPGAGGVERPKGERRTDAEER